MYLAQTVISLNVSITILIALQTHSWRNCSRWWSGASRQSTCSTQSSRIQSHSDWIRSTQEVFHVTAHKLQGAPVVEVCVNSGANYGYYCLEI